MGSVPVRRSAACVVFVVYTHTELLTRSISSLSPIRLYCRRVHFTEHCECVRPPLPLTETRRMPMSLKIRLTGSAARSGRPLLLLQRMCMDGCMQKRSCARSRAQVRIYNDTGTGACVEQFARKMIVSS